ncbi:hypothetical protein [Gloeobacter morelensis]|uniref:Uncharacterized protein n=1 Tax=Gloeobacter morelensis MG652769 TaxID=2781736 RepID=A0ABY3PLS1_9CYAN|nr:hypothetical protein [Gloeobacter morelensis]UFP94613.1 hypothetical protein ISF26_23250 [Gloeobacter morelensis MG652769]
MRPDLPTPDAALLDDLETLLLALDMHPMFMRQPFKILRLNLLEMKADRLTPNLAAIKARFAAMPDAELFAAWGALHNPLRLQDRVLN